MRIVIDGDGCPSTDLIEKIGNDYQIPVLIYIDDTHNIIKEYAEVIVLSKCYQNVDMAIINAIKTGDIVITGDYGLALLVLSKNIKVINHKGILYDNIDFLIEQKHNNTKLRKQGIKTKGPKKRTKEDEELLVNNLKKLIELYK